MTNVDKLIELFGSARYLAEAIGISQSLITRWRAETGKGARQGKIPPSYNLAILDAARALGVEHDKISALLTWSCECCGQRLDRPKDEFWTKRRVR